MKASPAFQFYPSDFLVGTADMTPDEVGGYIRLLCYQWSKGGLPDDDSRLSQMSGCHGIVLASIRHKFGKCSDGLLRNERLEKVRNGQDVYRQKQSENAVSGWKKRKGDGLATPPHMPETMPNGCQPYALLSSSSISNLQASTTILAKPKKEKWIDPIEWTQEAGWMGITEKDRADWLIAYPACILERQLAGMEQWLKANPSKAKKTLWRKFMTTWMQKSQNSGGDIGSNKPQSRPTHWAEGRNPNFKLTDDIAGD